jgi:gluconolactonase
MISSFNGKPLNAPNDLVIHPNGSIYFSDPRYLGPEPVEQAGMFLFRYDTKSNTVSVATALAKKPNGVEISPDGKILYLAETDNGSTGVPGDPVGPKGRMQLLTFDVNADGRLANGRVIVDFGSEDGIDGLTVDSTGRIFAAVRSANKFGIGVYDASGNPLDFLPTPSLPTNVGFGAGNDSGTLYISAGGGLYRASVLK